jgi:cytoskeletal protein CcmA (bactofilin family)
MFSKPVKPSSQVVPMKSDNHSIPPIEQIGPAQRKSPVAPSLIAENMSLEGVLSADGELHVDGQVRGEIHVQRLTLGESGRVEGQVTAEVAEIRGRITGTLTAKQVRLTATAYVDGDITHEQLAIEAGAFFQGRSLKFQRPPTAPVALVETD